MGNPYIAAAADPLLVIPSAADGVTVTPSGVSDGYSAWAEVTASASDDWRVAGFVVFPGSFADGNFYEIELGVGAAASEVVVASQRGYSGNNSGGTAEYGSVLTLAIPADVVTAGQRVAVRMKQVSTNTSAWRVAVQYWALPLSSASTIPGSTTGPVNVPAGSRLSVSTGTPTGTSGAWVEVTAATVATWTIGNVVCRGPNFVDWELDIGTGAAGSETVLWTVKSTAQWFASSNAWQGGPWNILLRPSLGPIAIGKRVAIRIRSMNTTGVQAFSVGLTVTKATIRGASSNEPLDWTAFTQVLAGSGGWGNYGAWTEFIASTAQDIALCNITSTRSNTGYTLIEVGTGAAGSETVVARVAGGYGVGFGGGRFNYALPYARLIPAGSRVAVRITVVGTSAGLGHYFALGYLNLSSATPDFDNWSSTVVEDIYTNLPSAVTISMFSGASAWQSGAWVEVDDSVPVNRVISAFCMGAISVPCEMEFDLGIGAAGAEVVAATARWEATDTLSGGSFTYCPWPVPVAIPAASRLSIRARCSLSTARTFETVLLYSAEPEEHITPTPVAPATEELLIRCLRRSPHVSDTGQRIFHQRLQLEFQPGIGNTTAPGLNPQAVLRWSNDGGFTWSSERPSGVGPKGQYRYRAQWFQLGAARDRVYEVVWSDPATGWALVQAWIDVEAGLW